MNENFAKHMQRMMESDLELRRMRDEWEAVYEPLYDRIIVPEGATVATFFVVPFGMNGKTRADTNMLMGGRLPAPSSFLSNGFALDAKESDWALLDDADLSLVIGCAQFMAVGPASLALRKKAVEIIAGEEHWRCNNYLPYDWMDTRVYITAEQNFCMELRFAKPVKRAFMVRAELCGHVYRMVA